MEFSAIINLVLAPLCAALFGALATQAKQLRRSDKAMREGMRTLLRQQLVNLHHRYVVKAEPCPIEIKEQSTRIYEAYHALGGNGTGTRLYKEIMSLPTS